MHPGDYRRNSGLRVAEWISNHAKLVVILSLAATAALAVPMLTMAPDTSASQSPTGEVVDAQDLVNDRFTSAYYGAGYIAEAKSGNMLTREPLLELYENTQALRADPDLGSKLISYFNSEFGAEVAGVYTIADEADRQLQDAGAGGLAAASDEQTQQAIADIVSNTESSTWGFAESATLDPNTGFWQAPAIIVSVVADNEAVGGGGQEITLGSDNTEREEFARDVQTALRGDETSISVWGIAIDVNLTVGEQANQAGPFIGFTILAVLVVTGIVLRSYWAVAVAGAALSALMIWLKGLSNLVGLETDQVLSFIVPIAMISFGIDFAFHAIGRYREEALNGHRPRVAFVAGLGGVLAALVLALVSDSVAFLSNISARIESIIQFGIGAAMALVAAFFMLGIVTPLVVMSLDEALGQRPPSKLRSLGRALASGAAATGAMAVVLLLVYIAPPLGIAALAIYLLAFIGLPYWVVRRRVGTDVTAGSGRPVLAPVLGRFVELVARGRWALLPIMLGVSVAAVVVALQIEARFDVKDFFAADTDLVVSLDKLDEHVGQQGGEPATIYVESDLTQPNALTAIERFADRVNAVENDQLAVDTDGTTQLGRGVLEVVHDVMNNPFAVGAIEATTGVAITDQTGDGLPDTAEQLAAVYGFISQSGIPFDAERLELTPDAVRTLLWQDPAADRQATILTAGVVGSRAQENIAAARRDLDPLVDELEAELQALDPDAKAILTGSAIVRDEQLRAIVRALAVALPISVAACFLVAWLFMRSIRFALVSIVPILVVVSWLYAFMHLAGHGINVVTATIGAVSIGIGIDFAIHFVMRYREELDRLHVRLEALNAAGTGTGAALAASAVSSVIGFAIMALAPMPMFAVYGFLTAIMITMALAATLTVLPGLLVLTTKDGPIEGPARRLEEPVSQAG
ncbi:MAG: MMPL family transporter [Acidimicrobiia bacterium]|nr:MMPL family transporter [Acidimicrobiia bacterium]